MSDRTVYARQGLDELVRYDRQGRWYLERPIGRTRIPTVHEAAARAVQMEAEGGTIHLGLPGGKQFDAKVSGARRRGSR